ncbi:uncharacterized protein LOC125036014 isoform X1 [Penaeus chinensis]|uniref:uncharacterized protein LOC125036014 isoform X1 n=1 Tax=Penaeus chinensis TaxID=139456 RepID=UPI001FB6CDE1|nr:uncharacterized protein LOC125036014 isoform X1 [Penaeus chinensis]
MPRLILGGGSLVTVSAMEVSAMVVSAMVVSVMVVLAASAMVLDMVLDMGSAATTTTMVLAMASSDKPRLKSCRMLSDFAGHMVIRLGRENTNLSSLQTSPVDIYNKSINEKPIFLNFVFDILMFRGGKD